MMMRMASATWKAGLKEGTGMLSTESGLLKETPFTVHYGTKGRPASDPEELLAAAVASSFFTALSTELEKAYLIPDNVRVAAGLMMAQAGPDWKVSQIHLEVTVKLVKEDLEKFEAAANAARENCAVARLLTTKITMDARLESWQSFGEIERQSGPIPLGKRLVAIPLEKKNGAVE